MIGDETWAHHYDPENKRQSIEYCYKESPAPQKFKTKDSARKVMLTVFWNSEGIVLTCLSEKGTTANLKRHNETLKNLKKHITGKGAEI